MSEMKCPVCGLDMIANTGGWYCQNGHTGVPKVATLSRLCTCIGERPCSIDRGFVVCGWCGCRISPAASVCDDPVRDDRDEWRPCEDCATKDGHIKKLEGETARLMRLTDALTRYAKLLTGEIDSMILGASLHGWKSTRADAGFALRAEIEAAKKVGT